MKILVFGVNKHFSLRIIIKLKSRQASVVKNPVEPLDQQPSKIKADIHNFQDETCHENITDKEAILRGLFIVMMPILSAAAWYYNTYYTLAFAPVILYIEITSFTLYCPIKTLLSSYRRPKKVINFNLDCKEQH